MVVRSALSLLLLQSVLSLVFGNLVQRTPRLAPSNCRVVQEALRPVTQCPTIDACRVAKFNADALTQLAACKDTSIQTIKVLCSCSSIVRFATGPKRSLGHLLGAEKKYFF